MRKTGGVVVFKSLTNTIMRSHEDEILRELKAGVYRDCYVIYNRKSTDDADNQKNSIAFQKAENARHAERHHLPLASLTMEGFCVNGIASERHSGFSEDASMSFGPDNLVQYRIERPKYHQLMRYLSAGYFKGAIFLSWDRASRNKGDDTILRKLMRSGVDIHFALANYDKTAAGELHMDADAMLSAHHSRVTREKVTLMIRDKRELGVWTHRAPVGYLNEGVMERKALDPARAPIVAQLFERAAEGTWSLSDLARWSITQGFTTPPMRRRRTVAERLEEEDNDMRIEREMITHLPTINTMHMILTNRFYTGKVVTPDGRWIPSTCHEALVSEERFEMVQDALNKRKRSRRYASFLRHPLRGLVHCVSCKRLYTPYTRKDHLYYGARCRPACANVPKNVGFGYISDRVRVVIARLILTDDELAELDVEAAKNTEHANDVHLAEALATQEQCRKRLREKLAYIDHNRLSLLQAGAYTPEALATEERKLKRELAELESKEHESTMMPTDAEVVRDTRKVSELLKNAVLAYDLASPTEKEEFIRILFSELGLGENTLEYQCTNAFKPLESRFVASSALGSWLSDLRHHHLDILRGIAQLEKLLHSLGR
jgi:site-specific DNA recombinase